MSQQTDLEGSLTDEIVASFRLDTEHAWYDPANPALAWYASQPQFTSNNLVQRLLALAADIRDGRTEPIGDIEDAVAVVQGALSTAPRYVVTLVFGTGSWSGWLANVEPKPPKSSTSSVSADSIQKVIGLARGLINDPDAIVVIKPQLPETTMDRLDFIRSLWVSHTEQTQRLWAGLRQTGMTDDDIETALRLVTNQC